MGEIETIQGAREALRKCIADIDAWADGERGHVLQDARDAALSALESLEPTPPAECGCRKALELAVEHLEEMRTDPKWHPIGRCPVLVECRAALSSPCSPCSALKQRVKDLEEGLRRAAGGGIKADWFCGRCGYELRQWLDAGASGPLPELCVLCSRVTPPAKESREAGR